MIQIVSAAGVTEITQEDFQELLDLAEDGLSQARQYDMSSDLTPFPDPQADAEREALLEKCRTHLE